MAGILLFPALGLYWLTHQEKLDPESFVAEVGWADRPDTQLIFPETAKAAPQLPRSAADLRTGLANMLRSDRFSTSALLVPGGQSPDAIPLVLIHGLMSTPEMWRRVVESLRSDPDLAKRYQFWFFYYPTGQPIPLTALHLRETLDEAARRDLVPEPAVLVGHSMGGIVARSQAIGLDVAAAEAMVPGVGKFSEDQMVRRALVFPARRDVGRIVFIATPHRGTDFAFRGISRLGHYLIRVPSWMEVEISLFEDYIPQLGRRRFPTSIVGLAPGSTFLRAVDEAPLRVPVHSIIPLLGDSTDPFASDGIVPFWSSRLPVAESELVVPGDHGAFDTPESLRELHRILRRHAGLSVE